MKLRKLRSLRTKKIVTVCYAGDGRRIFRGMICDLPDHLKDYYISYIIVHKDRIYLEATENKEWLLWNFTNWKI